MGGQQYEGGECPSLLCFCEIVFGVLGAPITERMQNCWSWSRGESWSFSKDWSTSPMTKDWKIWPCLAWRSLWENLMVVFQYMKRAYKQEEDKLFTWSDCDRIWRNSVKLKDGRFKLDVRFFFFFLPWGSGTTCPEKLWILLSLEAFKVRLDGMLDSLI